MNFYCKVHAMTCSLPRTYAVIAIFLLTLLNAQAQGLREHQLWDNCWRFHLDDEPKAQEPSYDDANWRLLNIPHDWSIDGRTSSNAPTAGGGGFFQAGTGWYRRTFSAPTTWIGKRILVEFEGVSANAEIWLNGESVATHANPFTSFFVDLTPKLQFGRDNFLAIRVNNSPQPKSCFYTGSGLYRHVWLHVMSSVHITPWGIFPTTTALSADSATVEIQTTIRNSSEAPATVSVQTQLLGPGGFPVQILKETPPAPIVLVGGGEQCVTYYVTLKTPQPWSPETPVLYRATARVMVASRVVDEVSTTFGIRTVKVSASRGFELNGKPLKLRGGNIHSDHGPLGAAAFDRAEERKVQLLKTASFNAIRTAHNPPAPAFLAACDRLGLLVVEEAFECGEKGKGAPDYSKNFKEWSQRDIDAMVMRDRKHPSVIMWSIGNEPSESDNATGLRIATELSRRIRALDATRPLTAGITGLGKNGDWTKLDPLFATLDVSGYNYELTRHAEDHTRIPDRVIMATESYPLDAAQNWSTVLSQPYILGDFVWSALDYLGEAGIGRVSPSDQVVAPHWAGSHYPWHGAACGDIVLTGFRKPISYYREIIWSDRGTKLYAAVLAPSPDGKPWNLSLLSTAPAESHWTWTGQEGKELQVEVYSRYESVRLYLNGRLLGEKPTAANNQYKAVFSVPYTPGTVTAAGVRASKEVERFALQTAEDSLHLNLSADRTTLQTNTQDLAYIVVEAVDKAGRIHPRADQSIFYSVTGPATIVAIGSADLASAERYNANPRRLHQGRALVILRTTGEAGKIVLSASMPGQKKHSITLLAVTPP